MNEHADIAPRGSLLDAFAKATERPAESSGALTTVGAAPPVERVIGAQQIAILRDEKKILEKIKVLAAAAGADWYYRFPVKTKGGATDWIEGPSIKLANDLARLYGNCEVETRVTDLGDSWLIYARFTDYETGFVMTRPFQQRKGQRGMRTESDRALDIAFQIGASKAIRNVIVNSLQTFADFAFDEARNALVEKIGKNLEGWRERCTQRIAERKIELNRVERTVGRAIKDWTAPDIARVVAMMQSIADGMTTTDEAFPPLTDSAPSQLDVDQQRASSPRTILSESPRDEGDRQQDVHGVASVSPHETPPPQDAPAAGDKIPQAVLAAFELGKRAKAAGHQRKSLPADFRNTDRQHEALSWMAGYDGKPLPQWENE